MKLMSEQGKTAARQADKQARRELLAAMTRKTGDSDYSTRRPETTAALVALLAEHGLRRNPENDALDDALGRAMSRQARAASGGVVAHAWLRATDNAFARSKGLRNIAPVTASVSATGHDGAEARLVGLLAATLASYYRDEDINAYLATHDHADEYSPEQEAALRSIPKPRYRLRFVHRMTPARKPSARRALASVGGRRDDK